MNKRWVGWGFGLIAVVTLAIGAQRVGGIAVRSVGDEAAEGELSVSEPVVLGVPVRVLWQVEGGRAQGAVRLRLRTDTATYELGEASAAAQGMIVSFPCAAYGSASLTMVVLPSEAVLIHQPVELLAPGADCV